MTNLALSNMHATRAAGVWGVSHLKFKSEADRLVNKYVELIDQAVVGLESLLFVVQEGSCNALPTMCTHSEIPAGDA